MNMDEVRREVYDYLYRHQTAELDDIIEALDRNANNVYGGAKHLVWDGYLKRDGPETFSLDSDAIGLCAECNAETELNDEILEVCPECGWQETWTCGSCGAEEHDAIEFEGVEVDVTCKSVYITPVDGGNGFAFSHGKFQLIIDHFVGSDYAQ